MRWGCDSEECESVGGQDGVEDRGVDATIPGGWRGCVDSQRGSRRQQRRWRVGWLLVGWGTGRCALKGSGMEFAAADAGGEAALSRLETSAHTLSNRTLHCAGAGVDAGGWGAAQHAAAAQQAHSSPGRRRCRRQRTAAALGAELHGPFRRAKQQNAMPISRRDPQGVAARMNNGWQCWRVNGQTQRQPAVSSEPHCLGAFMQRTQKMTAKFPGARSRHARASRAREVQWGWGMGNGSPSHST